MLPCQLRMSSTGIPQIRFPISRMYLLSTELSHFTRAVMNSRAHFFAAFEVELRSGRIAGNSRHEQPPPASATCLGLSVADLCLLEQTCYSVAPQRRLDAYAKRDVTRGNPNSTTSAKSDFRYSCTKPGAPCLGNSGEAWPSDLKRQRSWQIGERRNLARRTTVTLTARPHRPRRPTSTASGCRAAAA